MYPAWSIRFAVPARLWMNCASIIFESENRFWKTLKLRESNLSQIFSEFVIFLFFGLIWAMYNSADYDLEYSSAAFNRLRISISALNGAILKVVDLKLAEHSSVKAVVNLNLPSLERATHPLIVRFARWHSVSNLVWFCHLNPYIHLSD